MSTTEGSIEIELFERAAPTAVAELVALVRQGYYTDLPFDFIKPWIEIMTAERASASAPRLPTELDAEALGLHERRIASRAEASTVLQMELIKSTLKDKRREAQHPQLRAWLDEWERTGTVDMLLGVSRQQINEAMGSQYRRGLESRPVTKGAVTLKPASPTTSTPRLNIALTDLQIRDGQWMTIGRVVAGLEVADAIAKKPRSPMMQLRFTPLQPVLVRSLAFACSPSPPKQLPSPGEAGAEHAP